MLFKKRKASISLNEEKAWSLLSVKGQKWDFHGKLWVAVCLFLAVVRGLLWVLLGAPSTACHQITGGWA